MIVTRTVIVYLDSFVKVAAILDLEPIFVQKVIGIGAHYLETPKMCKYRYDVLKYTNIKLIFLHKTFSQMFVYGNVISFPTGFKKHIA